MSTNVDSTLDVPGLVTTPLELSLNDSTGNLSRACSGVSEAPDGRQLELRKTVRKPET